MKQFCIGNFDYERYGHGYGTHRRTDHRIAAQIHRALGSARTVLNVGAGAGSYEPTDRWVLAVEPSAAMRAQRPRHLAPAIAAVAEDLPLDGGSVEAAMATVTVHHWADPARGLRQLRRVSRGPVVILTFDPDALDRFWLADYVPELIKAEQTGFPRSRRSARHSAPTPTSDRSRCRSTVSMGLPRPTTPVQNDPWRRMCDAPNRPRHLWILTLKHASSQPWAWDEQYGTWRSRPQFHGALRLIIGQPDHP